MTTRTSLLRQPRWLLAALVLVPVLMLALQGLTFQAKAADLDWVDGGDDQLCLQDDNGAALTHPEIEQCSPIIGCETGETNGRAWIRFPTRNGIWQPKGEYADYLVLYGNEQPPSATPTPTPTPTPTASASPSASPGTPSTPTPTSPGASTPATPGGKPTKGAGGKPGGQPSGQPSAAPTPGVATPPDASDADDLGLDEGAVVAEGAPTAPAAPTVTVEGKDVTVSWTPTADAELEGVTGYVLRFSGTDPVETDATTTSHTFTGLADGNYRAAVRAVNEAGESPSSPPSEIATVGTPITDVVGTVTVEGDLEPGATVTITGAGYAPNVPELVLELHSTPIQIGAVATDQAGAFATTVTLPADVEPGDHHVVVLYDGTEISSTPVQLVAAEAEAATTTDEATAPAETVPPQVGVLILGVLAAFGFAALGWHLVSGRRRRAARTHAVVPTTPAPLVRGLSGSSTEVIGSSR